MLLTGNQQITIFDAYVSHYQRVYPQLFLWIITPDNPQKIDAGMHSNETAIKICRYPLSPIFHVSRGLYLRYTYLVYPHEMPH